ncbi:hypothetical protein JCM15519_08230 [Fundidesulfovibrio butyratiphilus]
MWRKILFWNGNNIDAAWDVLAVEPEKFPQEPFHPVAIVSPASLFGDRRAHTPMRSTRNPRHEQKKTFAVVAATVIVTSQKVRAAKQAKGAGKT